MSEPQGDSLLSTIRTTRKPRGRRIVIHGKEKMGKSTFLSECPDILVIPLEIGYETEKQKHAVTGMCTSLQVFVKAIQDITTLCNANRFPYKALGVDSLTALERLLEKFTIASDPSATANSTMITVHGGFGKGYDISRKYLEQILQSFDVLAVNYGLDILCTAHSFAGKIADPTAGEYDQWDLLLHSPKDNKKYGNRELVTQWADFIGFIYEPLTVMQTSEKMARGISQDGGRVLGVDRTPSYVAGNRFGITGEIPLTKGNSWNAFSSAFLAANK